MSFASARAHRPALTTVDPSSRSYGYITTTPKEKWRNVDILGAFRSLNVPIGFDTDVQAAALGELAHGQHG